VGLSAWVGDALAGIDFGAVMFWVLVIGLVHGVIRLRYMK
jgi:hypothetical protein